jgi:hypothetical protein
MRRHRALIFSAVALAATVAAIAASLAHGFGTVNRFGQHAEHERITRASLACGATGAPGTCFQPRSILNLAGGSGSFGGVGAPDSDEVFTPEAHCDDADFLATAGYPQTRRAASAQLITCRAHLQGRFRQAVTAAAGLLDGSGRLIAAQVDLTNTCTFTGGFNGRAKCNVLEGFGRALHGVQDFYSHSNYADERDPARPAGVNNPPGLANTGPAAVMSLRGAVGAIPADLSTGCFVIFGNGCRNRVTHDTLNKDNGIIDPVTGAATGPTTARGRIGTNFARAVAGAIADTRRQWSDLAAEIVSTYGATKGNLMVCAISHDDPLKDCTGRRIVIVVDSSGSNTSTDPGNLRISAAQAFNEQLISAAEAGPGQQPDLSASVDFDDTARLLSPLGDPPATSFAGIDSSGGTDIGAGVSVAIGELTKDPAIDPRARSGIVVLTDGQDGGTSLPGALAQAAALGIRVSFGFLSPPPVPPAAAARKPVATASQAVQQDLPDYLPAILATGGTYAVIDSAAAQTTFVGLAQQNGLTNLDDPNGGAPGGPLAPGLASAGLASPSAAAAAWSYRGQPGASVTIAIQGPAGQPLQTGVTDPRTGTVLGSAQTPADGAARYTIRSLSGEFEIGVAATAAGSGAYTVRLDDLGTVVSGTPGPDTPACPGPGASYVLAGDGNDNVVCGGGPDTIEPGPGADIANGGAGDDVLVVRAGALARGTEILDGGPGADTALFLIDRPEGVKCKKGTASSVRTSRRALFRLRNVETVLFNYEPCAGSAAGVALGRLRPDNARTPALVAPKPRLKAKVTRRAVTATVRVGAATTLAVEATVKAGKLTAALEPVVRNVPKAGSAKLVLIVTPAARKLLDRGGQVTVKATTAGVVGGTRRTATVRIRLRR